MNKSSGCAAFDEELFSIAELCRAPINSSADLKSMLEAVHARAFAVDFARYNCERLKTSAPELLDDFYDLRLGLRDRIGEWRRQGFMTPRAEKGLRDSFRALRNSTDLIGELMIGFRRASSSKSHRVAFSRRSGGTLFHPSLRGEASVPFRSGDIIVVRGTIHNSAAIARIGDVDSQFSHAAIVYIDPGGRQYAVESLIEQGAVISSLHSALAHNLGRTVVFRHPDARLAQEAAKFIFDHVRQSRSLFARRIPYDFSMELQGYDKLFCSKLVRQAYDYASNGRFVMPAFRTRFDNAPAEFLEQIGVTARTTIAPGDLELEPDLLAIAEWRDFERTSQIRLHDFIMDKLFEWMSERDYAFRETFWINALSRLGRASAYIPWPVNALVGLFGIPRVPMNMQRSTISAIAMLHATAEPLYKALSQLERRSIAERGHPLHPREVLDHLEAIRDKRPGRIGLLQPA